MFLCRRNKFSLFFFFFAFLCLLQREIRPYNSKYRSRLNSESLPLMIPPFRMQHCLPLIMPSVSLLLRDLHSMSIINLSTIFGVVGLYMRVYVPDKSTRWEINFSLRLSERCSDKNLPLHSPSHEYLPAICYLDNFHGTPNIATLTFSPNLISACFKIKVALCFSVLCSRLAAQQHGPFEVADLSSCVFMCWPLTHACVSSVLTSKHWTMYAID